MGIAPSVMRGRPRQVTKLYEDLEHPERVTSEIHSPDWTEDDRALLLGLQAYEDTMCPGGCGFRRDHAWHDMLADDWMGQGVVCHACTARDGTEKAFQLVALNPDLTPRYLASVTPLELGVNTTEPTPPSKN